MTESLYNLPAGLAEDIDAYEREVARFLAGELPAGVLKAKRVPRGVYEQRRDGAYMVRVRIPGGSLTPDQARALAAISSQYGDGRLHVTTRQDLQFHDVAIGDTPAVMRRLLEAGLTSKGGGGNTVRNVTACPYAGVCPAERFDVTPCARSVTEYLIPLTGSYNLPRKYKIAFSGCAADCALAQVADLGFVAAARGGKAGFRVLAGGGLGAHSRAADVLAEWLPAAEIIRCAEAVRRLFDRHGDRNNRHRARLRYVFERLGLEAVKSQFGELMAELAREGVPDWRGEPEAAGAASGPEAVPGIEIRNGVRVVPQRQPGLVSVPLHLPLGFLPGDDLARIGDLAEDYSVEGALRATRSQNLLIRHVPAERLPGLADGLAGLKTDVLTPVPLDRFVACAGASTCRLGICLARSAAQSCAGALGARGLSRETLDAMEIYINGCANSCGHQPVGAIGLFGAAQRTGERLVPSYVLTLGGRCGAGGVRMGAPVARVASRALPPLMADLGADFEANRRPGEVFTAYFDRKGAAYFEALAAPHAVLPGPGERPDIYRDLGAAEDFSLAGRGAGECGAGVFEVIRQDLEAARTGDGRFGSLLPAARALLITRGVDGREPDVVLREFERLFIDTGLAGEEFRPLLARGRGFAQGWQAALDGQEAAVARLRERVELLYATLDASLEFHPPEKAAANAAPAPAARAAAELDLRGVACPMNFVKAKLRLETLAAGDLLSVVLDEGDPIRNVPESFRGEGQEVVETTDLKDGHWRLTIRKKG
jgi:sulfite reductase (ferredoxin)